MGRLIKFGLQIARVTTLVWNLVIRAATDSECNSARKGVKILLILLRYWRPKSAKFCYKIKDHATF